MTTTAAVPSLWSRHDYSRRGLALSYLDTTPEASDKPVVLLLHGFPDSAEMWSGVARGLVAAGYRCIAPDTVGCGESAIAPRVGDHRMSAITGDFIALLDRLGIGEVAVIGHDWGALLAWYLAAHHPQRVRRMVAVSVGHPMAYAHAGLSQKLRGWYTVFFQLRGVAEYLLQREGPTHLTRLVVTHPNPVEVMQRMHQPGRLTAALRIYRANLLDVLFKRCPPVKCPVLGVWSTGDDYLTERQMRDSVKFVEAAFHMEIVEGGHWIPLEQAEVLARQAVAFFGESAA